MVGLAGNALVPGGTEVVGVGDGDALQAEAGLHADVGPALGLGELRRALRRPLAHGGPPRSLTSDWHSEPVFW